MKMTEQNVCILLIVSTETTSLLEVIITLLRSQGWFERPPAIMAMMGMISQPNRVVRVLVCGEKLDAGR